MAEILWVDLANVLQFSIPIRCHLESHVHQTEAVPSHPHDVVFLESRVLRFPIVHLLASSNSVDHKPDLLSIQIVVKAEHLNN